MAEVLKLLAFFLPALLGIVFFPAMMITYPWGLKFHALRKDPQKKHWYYIIALAIVALMAGILALLHFVLGQSTDSVAFKICSGLFIGVLFTLIPRKTEDEKR